MGEGGGAAQGREGVRREEVVRGFGVQLALVGGGRVGGGVGGVGGLVRWVRGVG